MKGKKIHFCTDFKDKTNIYLTILNFILNFLINGFIYKDFGAQRKAIMGAVALKMSGATG